VTSEEKDPSVACRPSPARCFTVNAADGDEHACGRLSWPRVNVKRRSDVVMRDALVATGRDVMLTCAILASTRL